MDRSRLRLPAALPAVLLVLSALLASGCGSGDGSDRRLSEDDMSTIRRSQQAIGDYCRKVGLFFTRRGPAPTADDDARASAAVDALTSVARDKPLAEVQPGQTTRDLVGDTAENLEASNCSPALVHRLEQALASLPSG